MTSTTATLRVTRDQLDKLCRGDERLRRQFELLFAEVAALAAGGGGGAPSGPAGGDLTGTYPNPSIAANAVDNTKLADMTGPTFKGRASGTGDPQDLTPTQAKNMLIGTDPGGDVNVAGIVSDGFIGFNLTHDNGTKTTKTSTLAALIDVQTPLVAIDESGVAPTPVADKAIIYVDASNNVLAMKESGTATRLDAIRVADSGAIQGTRREINFTGAGVTVTDDAGNDRVNIDIPGGGGGGAFGQATATFTGNQSAITVNVSDVGVGVASNIVVSVDMGARFIDEFEMAPVIPVVGNVVPGVGFDILVVCPGRDAVGAYLINYTRD